MDDWVKHSLEVVAGRNDVLLLIKPHPHELREDIATYPSEMLQDWIPPDAPDNVIFLPHDMFNLYEVVEFIDLAVMWNGSSSIELGILEIPTVVCGLYGEIDYPVGHIVPCDRDHYGWLLTHPKEIVLPPDVPARSRALLEYRASVNVSTPYRYTRRGNSNKKLSHYEWFSDDLKRYYSGGDEFVTLLADRIHNDLMALQKICA
jgi:capsular polysaccharide export protein